MCELGTDFYENHFKKSVICHPHPYTDSIVPEFDNVNELISSVTLDELFKVLSNVRKRNQ